MTDRWLVYVRDMRGCYYPQVLYGEPHIDSGVKSETAMETLIKLPSDTADFPLKALVRIYPPPQVSLP